MNNGNKIKIVIADDHDVIIDGLIALLSPEADMDVTGRANNGSQLLQVIKNKPIDLIILDIDMPEMNGVEAAGKIRQSHPDIKILVLTMHNSPDFISNLMHHGVHGYILKNTRRQDLLTAIRRVMKGETFYTPEVARTIMESLRNEAHKKDDKIILTKREKEIIRLITDEYTSREIGKQLFISHHTVERHRKNIIAKLGVKNVAGLVKYAMKNGLAD